VGDRSLKGKGGVTVLLACDLETCWPFGNFRERGISIIVASVSQSY
jgi:hypothetical protein